LSSASDFEQLPTIAAVEKRVRELHQTLGQLATAFGVEIAQVNKTVQDSTAITDQVLQEMGLQITFLMQTIRVSRPLHGGLADHTGKVPMEVKTASQVYQESGRQKLLDAIEVAKRAQGLPTAESTSQANGEDTSHTPAEDGADAQTTDAGPKPITH
jgi:hypothetical protein